MTARAPTWFEAKYAKGVIQKLQSKGWLLKDCVNSTGEMKGSTVTWKVAGTGVATQMSTAIENRPVMNADRAVVTATMADYEANDWILTTDIEKMSENEQQVTQQTGGMAMGRKFDNIVLAAIDAAVAASSITNIVGDGTALPSILDIMNARDLISDVGVGTYEYVCALPVKWLSALEVYREFSSSDYVGPEYPLLKNVGARRWKAITFVPIPSSFFNVPSSNQADGYMWIKDAMGFTPNYEMVSRIDYVPEKKAYFAGNTMGCAAAVLLPEGFVRMKFATNVALARPSP